MNNRIVNFAVKKAVSEEAQGALYGPLEIDIFAPLGTNINNQFTPPPPSFNSELTLRCCLTITRSIRVTNPLTLFPIEFTRTDLDVDFCEAVSSISPRSFSAAHLSLCPFYLMNRVHLSTLDFQTGKRSKVLCLFGCVGTASEFAGPGMPLSMGTKPSIINADRSITDSIVCHGIQELTLTNFVLGASTTRGKTDVDSMQYTIFRVQLRCILAATRVGLLAVFEHIN